MSWSYEATNVRVVGNIVWGGDIREIEDISCIIKRKRRQRKDSAGKLR